MAINTLVQGLTIKTKQWAKTIDTLTEEGVINPKCWISFIRSNNYNSQQAENTWSIKLFYTLQWTEIYKDKILKYQEGVKFNEDVYSKVYEKLPQFLEQFARHDMKLQAHGVHHFIHQFNMLYHFFYAVIIKEKIELILFSNIPHDGAGLVYYEIAKALGIRTILLSQSLYPNKLFYLEDIADYGQFDSMTQKEEVPYVKIEKKHFMDHFYMRKATRHNFTLAEAIVRTFFNPLQLFELSALNYRRYLNARRYLRNLSRCATMVDYNKKYVYFPLHLQPEMTTSAIGCMFFDQLLAIEVLSKSLPEDWVIYVKENPKQKDYMRSEAFFARLKLLENVKMTHLSENTFKLMEHSQFVATITGTAGWEAICGGKPALIFGQAWYQNFEGAFQWHKNVNPQEIADYQIDHEKLEKDYNKLLSKCANGVIQLDYSCLVPDFDEKKNFECITNLLRQLISSDY